MDNEITSLTGLDVVQVNGRVISGLANGDSAKLEFPDDIMAVKVGKNGNRIYAFKESGKMVELELRIIRGCSDDQYLNGLLQSMKNDPAAFVLMSGYFVKRVGDGTGAVQSDVSACAGGVFKKQVGAKTSAEGDTEQSVAVYSLTFGNCDRSMQ